MSKRILLSVILLALMLAACNGDDETGEGDIDPAVLVADAAAKLDETTSFQLTLEAGGVPVELSVSSMGLDASVTFQRAEGNFVAPDQMQATVTVLFGSAPTDINIIAIGEEQFFSNQFITAGNWRAEAFSPGFNPASLVSEDLGIAQAVRSLQEPEYVGEEDLDGIPVHRVQGSIEAEQAKSVTVGLIGTESGKIAVDLFIRKDDGLLEKMILTEPIGEESTTWTVGLYGYNGDYTITKPEAAE